MSATRRLGREPIDHLRESPSASHVDAFACYLHDRRYASLAIGNTLVVWPTSGAGWADASFSPDASTRMRSSGFSTIICHPAIALGRWCAREPNCMRRSGMFCWFWSSRSSSPSRSRRRGDGCSCPRLGSWSSCNPRALWRWWPDPHGLSGRSPHVDG
jgi:hypothetical protein